MPTADPIEVINQLRSALLTALQNLKEMQSFQSLRQSSPALSTGWKEIIRLSRSPRLQKPCDGTLNCAFIGAAGAGLQALAAELFPDLARRGWITQKAPAVQALTIRCCASNAPDRDEVALRAWGTPELKALFDHPEIVERHRRDNIRVNYLQDGVRVDGLQAGVSSPVSSLDLFPFPEAWKLTPPQTQDARFIRALTGARPAPEPLLIHGDRVYHGPQLHALVSAIDLRDPMKQMLAWSGLNEGTAFPHRFILVPENPGNVNPLLRHALSRKGRQVALQLCKNDDLDLVVHLVSCGQTSDFAELWQAIADECGPSRTNGLAGRLIVAVTDTHHYFTDRDIRTRYEDPAIARHIGDHFAATLEQNILERLGPHGRIHPAHLVFLDTRTAVEAAAGKSYRAAYTRFRPMMERWLQPEAIGYQTLARLGLVESFRDNCAALADPQDRGQGFLVRRLLDLAQEKGPALLLNKYLIGGGLLAALRQLLELLTLCYAPDGALHREALRGAVKASPALSVCDELQNIEHFAVRFLDPAINALVNAFSGPGAGKNWVMHGFKRTCTLIEERIGDYSGLSETAVETFSRRLDAQATVWAERWGYQSARLSPADRGVSNSAELLAHCLKLHAREILCRLLADARPDEPRPDIEQGPEEQRRIREIMESLQQAQTIGLTACRQYGVHA